MPLRTAKRVIPKRGLTPLKLEHILLFIFGASLLAFGSGIYEEKINSIGKVIVLIIYLGSLVGLAPVPLPVFKKKFWQPVFAGFLSGFLDSYIVLDQCRRLRTVEKGQDREKIMRQKENQAAEGVRAQFLALLMIAAIIGGLILWFGEVYAAGLYINDSRTGIASALFVIPPALIFLLLLGLHASRLPIQVVPNKTVAVSKRDLLEFSAGIVALLLTHNPMLCLGGLLVYAVITRQDDHLLEIWKHHTEVNVMLVLLIALLAGGWLVNDVIKTIGLDNGEFLPIIPAAIQSVLWGPLYEDQSVHFWMRVTTLSTGALLLPISSLVGVMLFKTPKQWLTYMKFSFVYAAIWYGLMRLWIFLALDTPLGEILEQFAHT